MSLKKIVFTLMMLSSITLSQQLAFPSAEGFGRFATGGRGGEVYHVTNLNDTGAGSLRDAVSKSGRIVVFDVGGVINIGARLVIQKNIYVAGQTAPGEGITIYGNGVALNSSSGNSIIRYVRIRMGDQGDSRKDALGISDGQNYMFDNVSISWGWDGTVDVNGTNIDNITFQDCIISQGIDIVGHSTGGLMQSGKWSVIRSLYIDNETRNPKGKGTHEFINNVVYNWGSDGYIMEASEKFEVNAVGNFFIAGPSSNAGNYITRTTPDFQVYAKDNWIDIDKDGSLNPTLLTNYKTATVMTTPYDYHGTKSAMSGKDAFEYVLKNAGSSTPHDAVDKYLMDEVLSYGKKGAIIVRESDNGIPNNVGTVANGTPPKDTDRDGMPDEWEKERGLNPNVADDKGDDDGDGYTNIEEYLNYLVGEGDTQIKPKEPETLIYSDKGDKQYATSSNWETGKVPTAIDTAIIRTGECQLKGDIATFLKVEENGIVRMVGYWNVSNILLQGGALQVNSSNTTYGLKSAIKVEKPSSVIAGANVVTVFNSDIEFAGDAALTKSGAGTLQLKSTQKNFSGNWNVQEGILKTTSYRAVGKGSITVESAAVLDLETSGSLSGCAGLELKDGASLVINCATDTVTYLKLGDKSIPKGVYKASDFPTFISSTGSIVVLEQDEITMASFSKNVPGVSLAVFPNPITKGGGISYSSKFKGDHKIVIYRGVKTENAKEILLLEKSGVIQFCDLALVESGVYVAILYNGKREIGRVSFYY